MKLSKAHFPLEKFLSICKSFYGGIFYENIPLDSLIFEHILFVAELFAWILFSLFLLLFYMIRQECNKKSPKNISKKFIFLPYVSLSKNCGMGEIMLDCVVNKGRIVV